VSAVLRLLLHVLHISPLKLILSTVPDPWCIRIVMKIAVLFRHKARLFDYRTDNS